MNAQAPTVQVERVLDDLIQRLTDREKTPAVRAALIEARRLKNVTTRWAAIPPPPDARREMLTRVMELVSSVGSPLTFSSPPPPPQSAPGSSRPENSPSSRRGAMAHAPTEAAHAIAAACARSSQAYDRELRRRPHRPSRGRADRVVGQ